MRKILLFLPIFLFAGLNNSYAYKKGYQEGLIIKQMLFGKRLTSKQIEQKCLLVWQKYSKDDYINQNKDTFLKGCEAALSSTF